MTWYPILILTSVLVTNTIIIDFNANLLLKKISSKLIERQKRNIVTFNYLYKYKLSS